MACIICQRGQSLGRGFGCCGGHDLNDKASAFFRLFPGERLPSTLIELNKRLYDMSTKNVFDHWTFRIAR